MRAALDANMLVSGFAGVATHPEDDLVLATAVSAKARYLVTGDNQSLPLRRDRGVTVVSPSVFLALFDRENGAAPKRGTAGPRYTRRYD